MSDTTKYAKLAYFRWGNATNPNPRLAAPVSATSTTLTFTVAPKDEDDAVITAAFLMGIETGGYVEAVYVPAAGLSADGLTATGVTRGIDPAGLDFNTQNDSTNAIAHDADSPVSCLVAAQHWEMMGDALQGTIASGGENWQIGNGADNDITVYAFNGDANKPFWRYDSANSKWVFSNDGVSSTDFGTGAGVTGGDGITVTAGDIDIDLTDTVIFKDARTGNEKRAVATAAADGKIDSSFIPGNIGGITGEIRMWSTAVAPTGWLICDATAVSRTIYTDLFAVISTTYGVGDGSTTFNLPDFRGRTPIGSGTGDAGDATAHALASKSGAETHTLITAEMPAHTHSQTLRDPAGGTTEFAHGTGGGTASATSSTGGDGAHNNLQPLLAVNFIIKT